MTTYRINHIDFLNRASKSALIALLVTFALLSLMHFLIKDDYVHRPKVTKVMPSVVLPKEQEIKTNTKVLEPPEPVDLPPTAAPSPQEFTSGPTIATVMIPPVDPTAAGPSLTVLPAGEPIPYLRSQPIYPRRAQERGISGYVDLIFAINVTGATEDVQVIGAEPPKVFDRAALRAVQKWKYRPQIADNGEAVRKAGVTTRVRFQIAK